MLEPIHPILTSITRVHTVRHALQLIDGIDGAGLVLDSAHLNWDRYALEDLAPAVDRISTVQLADVPAEAVAERQYARAPFGAGILALADFVRAIEDAGYQGRYENEVLTRIPSVERPAMQTKSREWFESL
jgi:sugar phosphate isomerase/epimerase